VIVCVVEMRGDCMFCWDERWLYALLRWEVIVCFVEMRGDCMFCWDERWLYVLLRWEVIVCYNHLSSQQSIQSPLISTKHTITSHLNKAYNHLSSQQNIQSPLISTTHTITTHINKTYNHLSSQQSIKSLLISTKHKITSDCSKHTITSDRKKSNNHLSSRQNIQSPLISTKHTITSHLNKPYNHLSSQHCNKVCQWLSEGQWFSPDRLVSSPSKSARHDIADILLKVAINSITLTLLIVVKVRRFHNQWIIADKHWICIVITTSTTIPFCSYRGLWKHISVYLQ
jgi:hypothetical protein